MPAEKNKSPKKSIEPARGKKTSAGTLTVLKKVAPLAKVKSAPKAKPAPKTKPVTKKIPTAPSAPSLEPKRAVRPVPAKSGPAKSSVAKSGPATPVPAKSVPAKSGPAMPVPAKPVVEERLPDPVPAKKKAPEKIPEATKPDAGAEIKVREKKFTDLFGPSLPKGKGLNASGEVQTADEFAAQSWSILQFPPKTGRLTWVYATHGLSTACSVGSIQPTRIELVMHWREKAVAPIQILTQAAKHILQTGSEIKAGATLSEAHGVLSSALMAKHFLVLAPEPTMPSAIDIPSGEIRPLVLLGISQEELDSATKVRPDLADGKRVLMDALRAGGVFPVTDPKRQCMTRRRDFLRIWETAFRGARERKV